MSLTPILPWPKPSWDPPPYPSSSTHPHRHRFKGWGLNTLHRFENFWLSLICHKTHRDDKAMAPLFENMRLVFPGRPVLKNLPCSARTPVDPHSGKDPMLWGNRASAPQLLSLLPMEPGSHSYWVILRYSLCFTAKRSYWNDKPMHRNKE